MSQFICCHDEKLNKYELHLHQPCGTALRQTAINGLELCGIDISLLCETWLISSEPDTDMSKGCNIIQVLETHKCVWVAPGELFALHDCGF